MFNFEVWDGLHVSWLPVDRVQVDGVLVVEWDYMVDLPRKSNNFIHVVELVEDTAGMEEELPCELEKAADKDVNCNKCGV